MQFRQAVSRAVLAVACAGVPPLAWAQGPAAADAAGAALPSLEPLKRGTLFDASARTLPHLQGWVYLTKPLMGSTATATLGSSGLILDTTTSIEGSAGYFCSVAPRLEAAEGYRLRWTLRVQSERHRTPHRAGFSVLVLGHDRRGIELGFWQDEVFAQSGADFRHAEAAAFDTSARLVPFELRVSGDRYRLQAAGRPILAGPLRSYVAHWHPVYRLANIVFLGDDTNSACARVELGSVEVRHGDADDS